LLVVDRGRKAVHVLACLVDDEVAPEIEHLAGGSRRGLTRQLFAHDERDGLFERRIGLTGDGAEVGLGVFLRQHGGKVLRHAMHAVGTDRLDACLFDGVEDRPRIGTLG
jgi:hypothetical protein